MDTTPTQHRGSVQALQDAVEAAYRGSAYGVERTADGLVVSIEPSALASAVPLATGMRRTFRFTVVADPETATYRLGVKMFGVDWNLPGVSVSSVSVVQRPRSMKISATLRGTNLAGGAGEQRFEYDTRTDSDRIAEAARSAGWAPSPRDSESRALKLAVILPVGAALAALVITFGVLFATGVL